jgi:S-adenosyl-L-methionine hydrolase (adenosine-forming)
VAAHLAAGAPLAGAGRPMDPDELQALDIPAARVEDSAVVAHALAFDRFGNVMLDVEHAELQGSGLRLGHAVVVNEERARFATTFVDVPPGELLLYEDAYRTLALAVNRGSAAMHLGLELDAEVRIRPA